MGNVNDFKFAQQPAYLSDENEQTCFPSTWLFLIDSLDN